jgi:hypothetical protein
VIRSVLRELQNKTLSMGSSRWIDSRRQSMRWRVPQTRIRNALKRSLRRKTGLVRGAN